MKERLTSWGRPHSPGREATSTLLSVKVVEVARNAWLAESDATQTPGPQRPLQGFVGQASTATKKRQLVAEKPKQGAKQVS